MLKKTSSNKSLNRRMWVIILAVAFAFVLSMAAVSYAESTAQDNGIPIMTVTIDEGAAGYGTIAEMQNDKGVQCTGTVSIDVPDGFRADFAEGDDLQESVQNLQLDYIRGRGNSTWMCVKKPYKLKFSKKQNLFYMGNNKHWVLLANHFDSSLSRNRITFWLGRELDLEFTPHGVPVDLYMKSTDGSYDQYLGSYYLCEQIRVGSGRVDIDEMNPTFTDGSKITGGYLLNLGGEESYEDNNFKTSRNFTFGVDYPSFDLDDFEGNAEQREYITNYIQDVEDAIYAGELDHDAIAKMMDLRSAADYWWIQSFSGNGDGYQTGSTYLYKKRDGKLYWGPLWDFDLAWAGEDADLYSSVSYGWIDQLRQRDPAFAELLAERWAVFDQKLAELTRKDGVLDQYRNEIRASHKQNYGKYGQHTFNWEDESDQDFDLDKDIESIRKMIEQRRAYVNDHLDTVIKGFCTVQFMADGQLIGTIDDCRLGDTVRNAPDAPDKDGYVFAGWFTQDTGESIETIRIKEDMVFVAKYVKEDEATKAKKLFFYSLDLWEPLSSGTIEHYYTVFPEDAQDKRIQWSSSDESVATVDSKGIVTPHSCGHVDITAALSSGYSSSYRLHLYDQAVADPAPAELINETPELTIEVGEFDQFRYHADPRDEQTIFMFRNAEFTVDDENIVAVDDTGVISGLNVGSTTVRMTIDASDGDTGDDYDVISYDDDELDAAADSSAGGAAADSSTSGAADGIYELECKVTVKVADISSELPILAASSFIYSGKVIKPDVIDIGYRGLIGGEDFTVSYSAKSPKSVGTYTVTASGKGNYKGAAKTTYKIIPKGASIKKVKKGKKALTVKWGKRKTKMSKKRITGYQIQVATDKEFSNVVKTVKVKGYKKISKKIKGLKKKTNYYVHVRTYMKTGGETYYSNWSKAKSARTK